LMNSFASETAMSPVMDWAVELDARQAPASCAGTDKQPAKIDPTIPHNNLPCFISRG
jgi:hypothetical protein